jgi:hypothetical protein
MIKKENDKTKKLKWNWSRGISFGVVAGSVGFMFVYWTLPIVCFVVTIGCFLMGFIIGKG